MLPFAEFVLVLLWLRMLLCCGLGLWAWRRQGPALPGPHPALTTAVVMPAFNEALDIEASLLSLLRQDPIPQQIVVVDDGSIDGTGEIARRVLAGVEGSLVIRLPANGGKADALNAGIRAARCDCVLTLDADTRLEPGALGVALATMAQEPVDAVAFYLDVDNRRSLIGALQRAEYLGSLNFERAGQHVLGAISVLPGAATLFRRESLLRLPFHARSLTEDADLTLGLSRQGRRMVLAAGAIASTVVPGGWARLLLQRRRWIAGHLQCCAFHAAPRAGEGWRFRLLTFPNFLLSTAMAPLGFGSLLAVWAAGRTEWLHIGWWDAVVISLLIVYAQRGCAWLTAGPRRARLGPFVLEPACSNLVSTLCFVAALALLLKRSVRTPASAGP